MLTKVFSNDILHGLIYEQTSAAKLGKSKHVSDVWRKIYILHVYVHSFNLFKREHVYEGLYFCTVYKQNHITEKAFSVH